MMMNSKKQNANVNQNTWLCDKLLEQTESKKKKQSHLLPNLSEREGTVKLIFC